MYVCMLCNRCHPLDFVYLFRDIVQLLLTYEASPNILDTKGSSPLHLAAWAGHTGIVRLLLSHGPALTNVNLTVSTFCINWPILTSAESLLSIIFWQTRDNESALHCAAQYGHRDVVFMLLQHGADPTVCSVRDETALDLASQYGRFVCESYSYCIFWMPHVCNK